MIVTGRGEEHRHATRPLRRGAVKTPDSTTSRGARSLACSSSAGSFMPVLYNFYDFAVLVAHKALARLLFLS
jgi:hypothetical protein